MAHVEVAGHQHGLHRFGQVQQAQQVGGGAARTADRLRRQFVRHVEFLDQALQALRFFQRIQIFALNVFDQRHGCGRLVGHIADQHRQAVHASQLGRAETPLAGDDFVFAVVGAAVQAPHQNRLHDALNLDGFGEFVERAFVHARARLIFSRHKVGQAQRRRQAGAGRAAQGIGRL